MRTDDTSSLNRDEQDFLREMIDHHMMAIKMSRSILTTVKNHDIESLAYSIIQAQQNEIALMWQLLRNS